MRAITQRPIAAMGRSYRIPISPVGARHARDWDAVDAADAPYAAFPTARREPPCRSSKPEYVSVCASFSMVTWPLIST